MIRWSIVATLYLCASSVYAQEARDAELSETQHYLLGRQYGSILASSGITAQDLADKKFIAGLLDGINRMPIEGQDKTLAGEYRGINQILIAKRAKSAAENLERGRLFVDKVKATDGFKELSDGVFFRVLAVGSGTSIANAKEGFANITVRRIDGSQIYSTSKEGKPRQLDLLNVRPTALNGIRRMKLGEKWQIVVPSEAVYKDQGSLEGLVAPNETVIYELEMVAIK